jgi:hypothetical protein
LTPFPATPCARNQQQSEEGDLKKILIAQNSIALILHKVNVLLTLACNIIFLSRFVSLQCIIVLAILCTALAQ